MMVMLTALRALVGWRAPKEAVDNERSFSMHEESQWAALVVGLSLAICGESVALHFLLMKWSVWLNVAHIALMLYSILWLVDDYQGIVRGRAVIGEDALAIEVGRRWSLSIPLEVIEEALRGAPDGLEMELRGGKLVKGEVEGYGSFVVFGQPAVHLRLREPVEARGMFGFKREASVVGLSMDHSGVFLERLREAMANRGEPATA